MNELITRRTAAGWLAALASAPATAFEPGGEILYNGIRLPDTWPPVREAVPYEPMECPYLASPPEVIPIDVGRQLFVDDFLIAENDLERVYHQAEYHPASPLVKPEHPWESTAQGAVSMVFSDGVWFDPADRLFKMWYMAGYWGSTAYAFSEDGIRWTKPRLDVVPGTNIVLDTPRGSTTVWLDLETADPKRRYVLFRQRQTDPPTFGLHYSHDGIHWGQEVATSGPAKDRSTMFYNPFRKTWVFSLKDDNRNGRMRRYRESREPAAGMGWKRFDPIPWVSADRLDPQRSDIKKKCQLYNLDAAAYESVMLGLFSIWRGQPTDRPKPNEVIAAHSRDGFHWHRPDRRALVPVSEHYGDWNWGNVQSAGGCYVPVGDKLYFYVSGRAGIPGTKDSGVCTTGLATLRRDGFASMRAGDRPGTLTTRVVRFKGRRLFVNAAVRKGELRVEALDKAGRAIEPFTRAGCVPVRADATQIEIRWKKATDIAALAGKDVRFRFHLRRGDLYAFWT
jgi:hypothetical protein